MVERISSVLTAILLFSSLATMGLSVYSALFQRTTPLSTVFSLFMASITVYCLGYALEISSGTLERILFWTRIEYLGLTTIPAFWIIMALQYADGRKRFPVKVAVPLLCLSAAILAVHYTNDFHHLYYVSTSLNTEGPFPVIEIERGPWYYVQVAYVLSSIVFGALMFFRVWFASASSTRPQAALMLVGALCPGISSIFYLTGLTPYGMDTTPFALVVTGLACALGLFRFKFLDLVPVAVNSVFRDMRDAVVILDRDGRVAQFNKRAEDALRETQGLRVGLPVPDEIRRESGDITLRAKGEPRHYDLRESPVHDERGRAVGAMIVLVDITDRVRMLEEMRALAVTDELTGLCNRRQFMERATIEIERARRTGKSVSAIAVDLDHFKAINDGYGHAAGDEVLKASSAVWKAMLRPVDVLGRCGGEEFGILLPETPLETAAAVAERLREAIARNSIESGGRSIRVTASFGVACSTEGDGASPDGLLSRADAALYEAKAEGRDRVRIRTGR